MSARARIRQYLLNNVGRIVTKEELRAAAGNPTEWARRVRELRQEEGFQILSHIDREDLRPGQYVLVSPEPLPSAPRTLTARLRRQILERDGGTCQMCGSAAGEPSGCAPGRRCRLQVDHIIPLNQGGSDSPENLRAVCAEFNRERADVVNPASGTAIAAVASIRRLPRNVQREVFEFLKRKFEPQQ